MDKIMLLELKVKLLPILELYVNEFSLFDVNASKIKNEITTELNALLITMQEIYVKEIPLIHKLLFRVFGFKRKSFYSESIKISLLFIIMMKFSKDFSRNAFIEYDKYTELSPKLNSDVVKTIRKSLIKSKQIVKKFLDSIEKL